MRVGKIMTALGAGVVAMLWGCGPRSIVKDPSAITLKAALTEVGEGLAAMVKSQPQTSDFGIYPAEVTVSFNVAASGQASGSLLLTPAFPTASSEGERSGMKASVGESAARQNTVTVKFVNVLFAPQEALVQHVSGAQLFELRQAMLGIDPRTTMVPVQASVTPGPWPTPGGMGTTSGAEPTAAPAGTVGPTPVKATLPAMKFLSPFKAEEDPAAVIKGLTADKLGLVARAMNAKVGMVVVRTDVGEAELRRQVEEAANRLMIKRTEVEAMVAGGVGAK